MAQACRARRGLLPVRVGAHTLGEVLGRGGMAEVRAVGSDRALKWVDPRAGARAVAAFAAEVRVMRSLSHPHVLPVIAQGTAGPSDELPTGAPWMLMPRATRSLAEWSGDAAALMAIIRPLLGALAWAHAHGVVHRDVKPSNLLVAPDGRLWLADFGVADALERRADGTPGGTWAYMAPERLEGGRGRAESDLYSVGCTLHALWTGEPPFGRGEDCIDGHYYEEPPRLDLPFADWVARLLAKEPEERFPTAAHAVAALDGTVPSLGTGPVDGPGTQLWAHLQAALTDGPVAVRCRSDALVRDVGRRAYAEAGVRGLTAVWGDPPAAGDGLSGLLRRLDAEGDGVGAVRAALGALDGPALLWLRGEAHAAQALVARLEASGPLPILVVSDSLGLPDVGAEPDQAGPTAAWEDEHPAFEVAAALGRRVDPDEWSGACARLDLPVPWDRWEAARAEGRLAPTAGDPLGGWAFVADPPQVRRQEVHRACAAELESRGAWARAARHRVALGERGLARAGFVRAARAALSRGAPDEAAVAVAGAQALRAGVDLELLSAEVALERRRPTDAIPHLDRAVSAGGQAEAQALRDLGRVAWAARADAEEAIGHLQAALARATDTVLLASIHRHLGWMQLRAGHERAASAHLREARVGHPRDRAAADWGLGEVARRRGEPEARLHLERAIEGYRALGATAALATLTNTLGEVHRAAGDRTAARSAYEEALDAGRAVGGPTWFFPAYNLAVLDLEDGAVEAAATRLDHLLTLTAHEPPQNTRRTLAQRMNTLKVIL